MFIDKKCLKCPIRKFSLKAVNLLRTIYEIQEDILDVMGDFDTNISNFQEESWKVIQDEHSRCSCNH